MTLTYTELEHMQLNQHMVLLGVVDRRSQYTCNRTICSTRGECLELRSIKKTVIDYLIVLTDHHLVA